MHPILDALNGTQHEWLKKLLFTFNQGNIGKFRLFFPKRCLQITLPYPGDPPRKIWLLEDMSHGTY